jgi:hypothetical protein
MFLLTVLFAGFPGWFDQLNFDFNPKKPFNNRLIAHCFFSINYHGGWLIANLKYQISGYHPPNLMIASFELAHVPVHRWTGVLLLKFFYFALLFKMANFLLRQSITRKSVPIPSPRCCVDHRLLNQPTLFSQYFQRHVVRLFQPLIPSMHFFEFFHANFFTGTNPDRHSLNYGKITFRIFAKVSTIELLSSRQ